MVEVAKGEVPGAGYVLRKHTDLIKPTKKRDIYYNMKNTRMASPDLLGVKKY